MERQPVRVEHIEGFLEHAQAPEVDLRIQENEEEQKKVLRQVLLQEMQQVLQRSQNISLADSLEVHRFRQTESARRVGDSSTWNVETMRKHRRKQRAQVEKLFSIEKDNPDFERHLFIGDLHIPDHDEKSLELVYQFIRDFAPHQLHILGDFLNFTAFCRFDYLQGKEPPPIKEEFKQARGILGKLVDEMKSSNPEGKVVWHEGNHEARLFKFLVRQYYGTKSPLIDVEVDGEGVLSIPHLFKLKELGVEWVPMGTETIQHGIKIGHEARGSKSGYAAHGSIMKFGRSVYMGDTHRQALVWKTFSGEQKFGIEVGSLCKNPPTPQYLRMGDWQRGISIGIYSRESKEWYPAVIPILEKGKSRSFMFGGKQYKS